MTTPKEPEGVELVTLPRETVEKVVAALEEVRAQAMLDRIDLGDDWGCTPQRLSGLKALSSALSALRRSLEAR